MKLLDALEKAYPSMNLKNNKRSELEKDRFKSLDLVIALDVLVL